MKISATIITLNEERFIANCIKSLNGLCNEVIVVDSGSTDKTTTIAKKLGAKVYFRKFDNYANQKNFANEKATGEWILSIDGDEEIESTLVSEIINAIASDKYDAYSIPRKNIIFGKFIKFTRWQPELDRHIWLYKKSKGKWIGNVHEEMRIDGKVGNLKNHKIHYQYEKISEFVIMMNNYSTLEAKERYQKGERYSVLHLIYPIYHFAVRYIYRFGLLDGWRGFALSYLMAIYHLQVIVKLWEQGNK